MKKKKIRLFAAIPICLLFILVICVYSMYAVQIKAIGTIERQAEDLYYLEYVGDYGFDALLAQGGVASDQELAGYLADFLSKGFYKYKPVEEAYGCSTISAELPDSGYGFGRNFDWEDCTAMVIKSSPPKGYASISTSNLDFLGFEDGFKPEGFRNKLMSLAAVYVPMDGMNEMGLCVADLIIDFPEETCQDTGKPDLTTTTAIRLLLDKAANVEEAIALLEQYDMHSSAGMMHHLAISDAEGRSVVVEYVGNVMRVTETPVVTNFFLTQGEVYGIGSEESKQRYEVLTELYNNANGVMDQEEIKEALSAVRQSVWAEEGWNTQWSIVYNRATLELSFYHRENYHAPFLFKLE